MPEKTVKAKSTVSKTKTVKKAKPEKSGKRPAALARGSQTTALWPAALAREAKPRPSGQRLNQKRLSRLRLFPR